MEFTGFSSRPLMFSPPRGAYDVGSLLPVVYCWLQCPKIPKNGQPKILKNENKCNETKIIDKCKKTCEACDDALGK